MSKQTDASFFIVSSVPALYQRLLKGVASYQELGNRLLHEIETAHAFRQTEQVRELARILLRVPIREYRLIGQYYLVWCKCRESEYQTASLERIAEQTETYKAKALISRAALEIYQGNVEPALYFYAEAFRASPTTSDYLAASRGIALAKSIEGFHESALKDLESLIPLLKHADALTYYDLLNSYAVELVEHNRLSEAHNVSLIAASSRLSPYYPEWRETFSEIHSKRRRHSTVAISRPKIEDAYVPEIELSGISQARVEAAIEFMKQNLHRKIVLSELTKVVNLSTSRFLSIFKTETGDTPINYLIRLRLEKASHLLTTTFLSVKEIIAAVGSDKSAFGRQFKKRYDATPTEYRNRALRRH